MQKIDFIRGLKKLIKNRRHEGPECEKILSNSHAVKQFATFWDNNYEEIEIALANFTHQWMQDNDFTKEEMTAYKKGLSELPMFLMKCAVETED